MIRHIFIAPIKEGITEEKVNEKIAIMKEIENQVPGIIQLTVGKNTGWLGVANAVSMIIDVKDKAVFDAFLSHPYHVHIGETADDVFDTSGFVISQIEY
ncbi:Dabb family protein [Priestia aryabhattai]|uniref:Dabb family protein n=1 Tax=Priestia megaterium TaxID=1404 RepID=UPI003F9735E0